MNRKLGTVIAVVEIAAVAFLLLLFRHGGLPSKTSVILVFLLPITFGLHVFEEFFFPGGAEAWFKATCPQYAQAYTPSYFFKVNAIPLVLSVLVSLGAFNYEGTYSFAGIGAWLAFMFILFFNGVFHIRATIRMKKYSPGFISSIIFYIPLAITSLTYFLLTNAISIFTAIISVAVGTLLQPALDYIKKQRVKKGE